SSAPAPRAGPRSSSYAPGPMVPGRCWYVPRCGAPGPTTQPPPGYPRQHSPGRCSCRSAWRRSKKPVRGGSRGRRSTHPLDGRRTTMSYDRTSRGGSVNREGVGSSGVGTPGKRTLTESLPTSRDQATGSAGPGATQPAGTAGTAGEHAEAAGEHAAAAPTGRDTGDEHGKPRAGDQPEREIAFERKGRDGAGQGRARIASRNPSDFPD